MKLHKTLFISIGLTAFVLAMLAGVITTVKGAVNTDTGAVLATTTPVTLDAQQATSVASQYLNRTDMYSVETASISGAMGYKVVFSSGDVVYVGLDGQVLATEKIQPAVVVRTVQNPAPASVVSAALVQQQPVDSGEHEDHDDDND